MYAGDEQYGDEITSPVDEYDEPEHHNPYEENHFLPKFRATVHVHVETASRDCDGPLYRSSTWAPDTDESSDAFFARFMQSVCTGQPAEVLLQDDGQWVATFSYPTEEGYHSGEYRSCIYEECRDQRASQRDVYAERMGY